VIGLPSLRTLDGAQVSRIWLAAEPTDMRCSFDRLAERVRTVIGQDPLGKRSVRFSLAQWRSIKDFGLGP
jgi:transposase